jgi:hypothetical protein
MMAIIDRFRRTVENATGGDAEKAHPLGDYLTMMGIKYRARRDSARAQLTRAMRINGPLRDLVDRGLVCADVANRQPECFAGVEPVPSRLPVVIDDGPVADLRTFPEDNLTEDARDAQRALVETLTTARIPVRFVDKTARDAQMILFEVERQKLRADASERERKILEQQLDHERELNRSLVQALGNFRKGAAE